MIGNVWEWNWDLYSRDYPDATIDPLGASKGSNRVMRGGAWNSQPSYMRAAFREWDEPDLRSFALGFRLVRTAKSQSD